MAVRLLTRTGLLYQDLLRHGEAAPGALPPVLSVVLYNGRRSRWTVGPELGRAAVPDTTAACNCRGPKTWKAARRARISSCLTMRLESPAASAGAARP